MESLGVFVLLGLFRRREKCMGLRRLGEEHRKENDALSGSPRARSPDEDLLRYLEDEVDWHRRAGRILFFFAAGSLGVAGVFARDALNRYPFAWPDLIPPIVSGVLAAAAGLYFYRYYHQISRLKSSIQWILWYRIEDVAVKEKWGTIWSQ
ncbi:MAG TPA: hypothetical protein VJ300_08830 [Thermoplasmata archaeon]|nr:hypothetical protein [Thermoplasmata archaeon]